MIENPIHITDYKYAVVQVVCLLHENSYHLIFGSAELLPLEIPRPPDEDVSSTLVKRFCEKSRVFHRRYVVSAVEALRWYEQCRQSNFLLIGEDASKPTNCESLCEEPPWPQLITGNKFPVWGDIPSTARTHHLYPASAPPLIVKLFEREPEIKLWISDRTFTSFTRYPELIGSAHLLLPNPVFRDVKVRLRIAEDGSEGSAIEITPRAGMSISGIEAYMIEHRPTGISNLEKKLFDENPFTLIPHASRVEETELLIQCPIRGVLEWQQPSSYMRTMNINANVVSTKKKVAAPDKSYGVGETYEIPLVSKGWSSTIGSTAPNSIPARLRASESERRRSDEAERLGQKWFHGTRLEATEFIRSLISGARERVWIVDPYFATMELFSFALATAYSSVEVVILTGASTALKKTDDVDSSSEAGDVLLRNLNGRKEMDHIKVLVMTGNMPTVHDRFLVIDDKVWFTGNSLNSIGDRAGMMISLPAPEIVIEQLEILMADTERTMKLNDWVSQRQENRTK